MSYWIEVHCDVRSETPDPSQSRLNNQNICYGYSNDYPAALAGGVEIAHRAAVKEAQRRGWKRSARGSWVCPHCQKFPPINEESQTNGS